ncbi:MAG: pentapeptide repeat-containing protein [Thermomicrobiales bacterium]
MDRDRFDALTRLVGASRSRRSVVGAVVGALLLAPRPDAFADQRKRRGQSGKDQHRTRTRAEAVPASCFGTGACTPGPGANLAKCDFSEATLSGVVCTGCNFKNASLRGATASNANFKGANFDKTCLVDANLTGANLTNANLSSAIFCRTIMPDGSINNSGCAKGTTCCPTCIDEGDACGNGVVGTCCGGIACAASGICCNAATCASLGKQCGTWPDGCGGTLTCGICTDDEAPICVRGTCDTCAAACSADCTFCFTLVGGNTVCGDTAEFQCAVACSSDGDCVGIGDKTSCVYSSTSRESGTTTTIAAICGNSSPRPGRCTHVNPCTA